MRQVNASHNRKLGSQMQTAEQNVQLNVTRRLIVAFYESQ